MKKMLKQRILAVLALLSLLFLFYGRPEPVQAQAGTATEMLQEINNLRVANGLSALSVNNYLMLSAQNHADWIAETGQGGHVGVDGSYAIDRAAWAGYGEGDQIWVTENWARGPGLTVYNCIYVSWDDADHMNNMLTTWHNEFGAGVALDGSGFTVYVVNFGHTSSGSTYQPVETTDATTSTGNYISTITTATPGPDGTIIHTVQYGEFLYNIAEAYGITLDELLALNNLNADTAIYPDDQLLIREGTGKTPTPTLMATATQQPTSSPTQTAQPTAAVTPTPIEVPKENKGFLKNIFSGDTLWIGIGLVAVSLFGIVLFLVTSSRLK